MALIGPFSRCPICDELLDRPFAATSGVAFPRGHRLERYCDAGLHFDCLATWPDREEFSREYFVNALAYAWRGSGSVLKATARWFLTGSPRIRASSSYAFVCLRDWPFRLYSRGADWTSFVEGGYRGELVGAAFDAANEIMFEVRLVAPTLEALEALALTSPRPPTTRRSYTEFGDFLATLWGEEAYQVDWEERDVAERVFEERRAEEKRARAAAAAQSNARAQQLLLELEIRGSLRCPHCRQRAHRVRFIERSGEEKSYFICGLCGCSFAGAEAP